MGNRKAQVAPVPGYEPPKPDVTSDHLSGRHFEDYLSPIDDMTSYSPTTPLSAAVRGPAEPEWERREEEFVRHIFGENEVRRRSWQRMNEPGGKTFNRGDIIGK
jgi:hypothetical protein